MGMDLSGITVAVDTANKYSALITAMATALLAFFTFKYIVEIKKERRTRIMSELVNSILNPLASDLNENLSRLKENRYIGNFSYENEEFNVHLYIDSLIQLLKNHTYLMYRNELSVKNRGRIEKCSEELSKAVKKLRIQVHSTISSVPQTYFEFVFSKEESRGDIDRDISLKMLKFIIHEGIEDQEGNIYKEFWKKYENQLKIESKLNTNKAEEEKDSAIEITETYKKAVDDLLVELVREYGIILSSNVPVGVWGK